MTLFVLGAPLRIHLADPVQIALAGLAVVTEWNFEAIQANKSSATLMSIVSGNFGSSILIVVHDRVDIVRATEVVRRVLYCIESMVKITAVRRISKSGRTAAVKVTLVPDVAALEMHILFTVWALMLVKQACYTSTWNGHVMGGPT